MSRVFALALPTLWLCALGVGFLSLARYESVPGITVAAPMQWPRNSPLLLSANTATLRMFAHPRCPCTRASLSELSLLIAHCPGKVQVQILFFTPQAAPRDWGETDLWKSAAALPGVTVLRDRDGREAKRFHAETSGEVLLYDSSGRLLFQGGITAGRGHTGDNDGRAALEQILNTGKSGIRQTPIYGCPLYRIAAAAAPGEATCRK